MHITLPCLIDDPLSDRAIARDSFNRRWLRLRWPLAHVLEQSVAAHIARGRQDPAESGIQIVVSKTFNFILRSFRFLNVLEAVCVLLGAEIALTIICGICSQPNHHADQDRHPYPAGDQLRLKMA
ncbi:hypothetical protein [Sulfitobacter faviae]|uniref:hypothetical protein n=1 Tax=Sulfitobacter faviae TaxID=1775881 RepID=UPI002455AFC5|nr:hypothetical protein [Sulfitobacter faviae]MDH4539777.1 hypothetical protein [Sulfitobacter faviae]